jgi:type I restriction enzyme R subunit
MSTIFESDIEKLVVEMLQAQGYEYLSPEAQEGERKGLGEVVLKERLKRAIDKLNPRLPIEAKEQALRQVLNIPSQNLIVNNEAFHKLLTDGIEVEVMGSDGIKGQKVWLVDFNDIRNNDFVVSNQFTVIESNNHKRPDVILFVNGLPLVVIELKNPADENATVEKAYTQLQNYMQAIPSLFHYNGILVASDGLDAKAGTISSDLQRFMAWKSSDGSAEAKRTVPQMETLIKGMLNKETLLDLIKQFVVFETSKSEDLKTGLTTIKTIKKVASYHQYYAVNKAIASTIKAASDKGDRKAGVVWHTQGSGKSLSMVFFTGKVVLALDNPTVVVMTDRNDLDDQLFDTFAGCKQVLRQEPVQAKSREDLKRLLKVAGGGIIFTTIQKFSPEGEEVDFELLSERKNIIVIADEAHRSQYGFGVKTAYVKDGVKTNYGFAKYLRDAIPNASFIGFTGTPIEKKDASTPAVFGNYIDIYDIQKAVADKATVKIYYTSRLAKVHLDDEAKERLDDEAAEIMEDEEISTKEKAKAKWAQVEAIVGHKNRIQEIAKDIVAHFEQREKVMEGKGMIVCMSRRIAVELYAEITKLRPDWHNPDQSKGAIKVVMTSTSSDPTSWQVHHTDKKQRKAIGDRFKNLADPLKLVIVRDMWLTGFDVPCLHTMYVDKPMRGHNLMQAIARVNRVFKDKDGGLIVDYIGIASDLKTALADYTESGGTGDAALDQEEAVAAMLEKFEIVEQMFSGFKYTEYFKADTRRKLQIILEAQEHILGLENGKARFTEQVGLLSQAFALSVPNPKAIALTDAVGFFQAIKARLVKFESGDSGKSKTEIETAIRQIVEGAVVSDGIIDVFDAAGIKKPDISILSDEFLEEVRHMEHKNLAVELLKKILNDEIKMRSRKNFIQGQKLSEMLEKAIKKYQNNLLTAVQVIEELIKLAKEIQVADKRKDDMGFSTEDELAFYDALANNDSAKKVLGDKQLAIIAIEVFKSVRGNSTIDWTLKESVQAKLRRDVKRILNRYGYPPDEQAGATESILAQAKLLADSLVEAN